MVLDHIGLTVGDFEASKAFFDAALAPLGVTRIAEGGGHVGYGRDGQPQFWFGPGATPAAPMHIAFCAQDRAQVRAFHDAALRAGGRDNGAPGIRAHYHPNYYGAFVIGPDGHNVEAVCHRAEG